MPLTGEVEGEMLESASRFVGVATENVGANEPLDEVVAAFFDNRVVDRLQLHFKGDAGTAEFVCIVFGLIDLLVAAPELVADSVRGPLYETIRLFLSRTAERSVSAAPAAASAAGAQALSGTQSLFETVD